MGEIFVAQDTVLARKVAVKLLDERFGLDAQVRRRFKREALTAARLSGHPNIVTIFDVGEHDNRPFIVMEYMPGGTVADRAREGTVPRAEALTWLAQAASALDAAHAAGVVHRDVKPANLLIDERGNVQVGDFGVARVLDQPTAGLTATGTVLGTAGYLSPEQARGEPATAASDVYGLGVVAYELLTGRRPFAGGSAAAEAAAHLNDPVPPASEHGIDLPPEVDHVFSRALAKEPDYRYTHASRFIEELHRVLEPHAEPGGTRAEAPPPPSVLRAEQRGWEPEPVRRERSHRPYVSALMAGLALAALAGGGVLAAVLTSDDERPQATPQEQVNTVTQVTTVQGEPTTVTTTTEAPTTTTAEESAPAPSVGQDVAEVSYNDAVSLTDQATGLMRAGEYADALPLALRAYRSLQGSGDIYEAYAAYDAGRSYVELGNCTRGLRLLDASEQIQGERSEIDRARSQCE
jgi:hypothetical protein